MVVREEPFFVLDIHQREGLMPVETSTALITNDIVVLGLIAATLGVIFWTESRETGVWKKSVSYTHLDVYKRQVPIVLPHSGTVRALGAWALMNSSVAAPASSKVVVDAAMA